VLIDHALRQRAQNADVKDGVKAIPAQGKKAKGKSEGDKLEDPDPLEAWRTSRLRRACSPP
jgi:hypothetical protein